MCLLKSACLPALPDLPLGPPPNPNPNPNPNPMPNPNPTLTLTLTLTPTLCLILTLVAPSWRGALVVACLRAAYSVPGCLGGYLVAPACVPVCTCVLTANA